MKEIKFWTLIVVFSFVVGVLVGGSIGIKVGERQAFENLGIMFEGTTINVDFNETYIMDRTEKMLNETMEHFYKEIFTNKTG